MTDVLRHRSQAAATKGAGRRGGNKAVILLWMTGGPSQIDTWDPKPDRPLQNRGPFGVIQTKLPGVLFCEHLPKMASMLDRCTIIRSVDARHSNHEPNMVFQTGHLDAAPRINPSGEMSPAIGSVVARSPWCEPFRATSLRGVSNIEVAHRPRRVSRPAVRPLHCQPGRRVADLHGCRRRYRSQDPGGILQAPRRSDSRTAAIARGVARRS